jgi:hypothetical protein
VFVIEQIITRLHVIPRAPIFNSLSSTVRKQ